MELREKLVFLRKKKGLSQAELAEKINVSRQAISRCEVSFEYLLFEDKEETEKEIAIEVNDPGHPEAVEHSKKRVYHRAYYVVAALVVMTIGIVIAFTIHKSVETKQRQQNIVVIDSMEQGDLSGEVKEEIFLK